MKEYKIYSLNDPITNEVRYVGKTVSALYKRLSSHYRDKKKSYKTNWIKSLKKLKLKPTINLIEICKEKNWQDREKFWIKYYRSKVKLTNLLEGGQGLPKGYKHSEETIKKIQIAAQKNTKGRFYKGQKFSKKTNKKKAEALKKEICQIDKNFKLIKIWKGIIDASIKTKIDKNNISSVLKKRTISAGGYYWCYNKDYNNFKKRINFKQRQIIVKDENNKIITIFESIKETSELLKIERKHIENSLRRKIKKITFGYFFEYKK